MFLMCRVELKGGPMVQHVRDISRVPNVPCGVESGVNSYQNVVVVFVVPNVPCGVESISRAIYEIKVVITIIRFLMCRVELKAPRRARTGKSWKSS